MGKFGTTCLHVVIFVFIVSATKWCDCGSNSSSLSLNSGCHSSERKALLNFKHSLNYFDENVSSTWEGKDCCRWQRVSCDHTTGHVIKLHLHGYGDSNYLLRTETPKSSLQYLVELTHLEYLDLSCTDFNRSTIPEFMGSIKQLRYLNLSQTNLRGFFPQELGNLTNLQVLDLSFNYNMEGAVPYILQNLTSLEHLDLSFCSFSSEIPLWLGNLHSLVHLNLSDNYFSGIDGGSIWGVIRNLCSLRSLGMYGNSLAGNLLEPRRNLSSNCIHFNLESLNMYHNKFISGRIPAWLAEEFRSLKLLDLGSNNISGEIPSSLGMLSALKVLDLSNNQLNGPVPASLGLLSVLEHLSLSWNQLSGTIPEYIGQLSKLEEFDISFNPLLKRTYLSENHFANLSSLTELKMTDSYLTLKLPSDWVPPFQLEIFYAGTSA